MMLSFSESNTGDTGECLKVCVYKKVRAMVTESAFSIEELEDLYCLFKVISDDEVNVIAL